jgi:hypothetical protein
MIQVGKTYRTFGGQNVQIMTMTTTATDIVFTGDNGVGYDRFGRTERGHDLSLIVIEVHPAYPDKQLTENERELLQTLKDLTEDFGLRSVGLDTTDTRYRKAKDVIAKFNRVGELHD